LAKPRPVHEAGVVATVPAMGHGEGRRPVDHELEFTCSFKGGGGSVETVLIERLEASKGKIRRGVPFF